MSIDTAAKRASALGVGGISSVPLPDGTIDAGDRAQLAGAYRGQFDSPSTYPVVAPHRIIKVNAWSAGAFAVPMIDPGDSSWWGFDWTDALQSGVTLNSVDYLVPAPLALVDEAINTAEAASALRISGGVHSGIFMIEAAATLSNGELINRQFPVLAFNG